MSDTKSSDTATTGFARLHALGLIDAARKQAAVAHPLAALIKRDTSPSALLVWMVERRLLSHMTLDQMDYTPQGELDESQSQEGAEILYSALKELEGRATALNARLLDELLANALITHADRDSTPEFGAPYVLASPAEALALLVDSKVVSDERFTRMRERIRFERHVKQAEERAQVIEQAEAILNGWLRQRSQAPAHSAGKSRLRWWAPLLTLSVGTIVAYQFAPAVLATVVKPMIGR